MKIGTQAKIATSCGNTLHDPLPVGLKTDFAVVRDRKYVHRLMDAASVFADESKMRQTHVQ